LNNIHTVITGSGSFIPPAIHMNSGFILQDFYDDKQQRLVQAKADVIAKFEQITGISERRYADNNITASCMAIIAAEKAIADAGIDAETIDQLIVAHNFGDVIKNTFQPDAVPSLAARVKHGLGIQNAACVAYDVLFGCPGWLQGLIQANAFCKAGMAKRCLVIGTEALSRVIDVYDRDSMIFSDGAGAVVVEAREGADNAPGIMGFNAASFATEDINYIYMGGSNLPDSGTCTRYLKMQGRKVYEFALKHVPLAMKACIDGCNVDINDVEKIFIHQANEKMDEAIIKSLYALYGIKNAPAGVMPMNIHKLGNSSVATIPTLYDMVRRGELPEHAVAPGDIIIFASVGAGMNINAVCYRT